MRDLVMIAIVIAFFVLATWYVRACAWIVGDDPTRDGSPIADSVHGRDS